MWNNCPTSNEHDWRNESSQGSPICYCFTFVVVRLSHVKIWIFSKVIVWVLNSSKRQKKTLELYLWWANGGVYAPKNVEGNKKGSGSLFLFPWFECWKGNAKIRFPLSPLSLGLTVSTYFKEPFGVTKQIFDDHVFYSIGIHCMAHHTNSVMQILSSLPLVKHIESLLQTLHAYFAHSLKWHLEFTKLVEVVETKRNQIMHNKKIRCILMLSLVKNVSVKYGTLLMKRAMDSPTNQQVKLNY